MVLMQVSVVTVVETLWRLPMQLSVSVAADRRTRMPEVVEHRWSSLSAATEAVELTQVCVLRTALERI